MIELIMVRPLPVIMRPLIMAQLIMAELIMVWTAIARKSIMLRYARTTRR